jgi:hypothetical protein
MIECKLFVVSCGLPLVLEVHSLFWRKLLTVLRGRLKFAVGHFSQHFPVVGSSCLTVFSKNCHELTMEFCLWHNSFIKKLKYSMDSVLGPSFQSSSHVQLICTCRQFSVHYYQQWLTNPSDIPTVSVCPLVMKLYAWFLTDPCAVSQ